jgi:hypothetical protein
LFSQLGKIRTLRNRLAHALLDTSDEFVEKGYDDHIRITSYRDGVAKMEEITVTERISSLE